MVLETRSLTLYKDGKVEKTISLFGLVSPNRENIFVNYFGGFAGNMCYLQFFNYSLNPEDVDQLYKRQKNIINNFIQYQTNKIEEGGEITKGEGEVTGDEGAGINGYNGTGRIDDEGENFKLWEKNNFGHE